MGTYYIYKNVRGRVYKFSNISVNFSSNYNQNLIYNFKISLNTHACKKICLQTNNQPSQLFIQFRREFIVEKKKLIV